MKELLRDVFLSITPDNIKNNPLIGAGMDIFIESLDEMSILDFSVGGLAEKPIIKEESIKTYLNDLYYVIDQLKSNQKVIDLLNEINSESGETKENILEASIQKIISDISDEHFLSIRNYRQKKGTKGAIEFIYNLVISLLNFEADEMFSIYETDEPFVLHLEGSLHKEIYDYVVNPLSHPAGFVMEYWKVMTLKILDYFFPYSASYEFTKLEINCLCSGQENCQPHINLKNEGFLKVIDYSYDITDTYARTTIYFENKDVYIENTIETSGGSTISFINVETGETVTKYGDNCKLIHDIVEKIQINPDIDDFIDLIDVTSTINDVYDPEDPTLIEHEIADGTVPFLNWDNFDFWLEIGQPNITVGMPEIQIFKRVEKYSENIESYADFDPSKYPVEQHDIINGNPVIIHDLDAWDRTDGTIAGDAYYISHQTFGDYVYGQEGLTFKDNDPKFVFKAAPDFSIWFNAINQNSDYGFDFGVFDTNGNRLPEDENGAVNLDALI